MHFTSNGANRQKHILPDNSEQNFPSGYFWLSKARYYYCSTILINLCEFVFWWIFKWRFDVLDFNWSSVETMLLNMKGRIRLWAVQFDTFFFKKPKFQRLCVRGRPFKHIGTIKNALTVGPINALAF